MSRSDTERASVLQLIGSKLCGGEIGQDLNVCCDNNAAAAPAPLKQGGFEFKVIFIIYRIVDILLVVVKTLPNVYQIYILGQLSI